MTAAETILRKALFGSDLSSEQLSRLPVEFRNRSMFSAHVEELRVLHDAREKIAQIAAGKLSASEARRDLRALLDSLGYDPGDDRGTIKDLLTQRRLDLILQTNVRQARGYVQHLEATTEGALLATPGQELLRVRRRRVHRDWLTRWTNAGGRLYDGRMIALKTDPIWTRISRFGNPYPPFDFGSGMGVEGVGRRECIRLGVISPDDPPQKVPPRDDFNGNLQASVPFGEDSPEYRALKRQFGDNVSFNNGTVTWKA